MYFFYKIKHINGGHSHIEIEEMFVLIHGYDSDIVFTDFMAVLLCE